MAHGNEPTPDTDENSYAATTLAMARPIPEVVHADFARKLERERWRFAQRHSKALHERDEARAWAKRFRDLLAPLAWLDGIEAPNEAEKAIREFDAEQ